MQVVWSEIMAWINVVFGENRAKFKKNKTGFHPRQAWDKGTFISNHNNSLIFKLIHNNGTNRTCSSCEKTECLSAMV